MRQPLTEFQTFSDLDESLKHVLKHFQFFFSDYKIHFIGLKSEENTFIKQKSEMKSVAGTEDLGSLNQKQG